MTHDLKCRRPYFEHIRVGAKTFEIRLNDRGFKVGDILRLKEWNGGGFTGASCEVDVTYLLSFPEALKIGYVCMAVALRKAAQWKDLRDAVLLRVSQYVAGESRLGMAPTPAPALRERPILAKPNRNCRACNGTGIVRLGTKKYRCQLCKAKEANGQTQ